MQGSDANDLNIGAIKKENSAIKVKIGRAADRFMLPCSYVTGGE